MVMIKDDAKEIVEIKGRTIDLNNIKNPVLCEQLRKAASYAKRSEDGTVTLEENICFGWSKFDAWHNAGW